MKKKQVIIELSKAGKRWTLSLSGTDAKILEHFEYCVLTAQPIYNFALLNGALPFGSKLPAQNGAPEGKTDGE